MIEIVIFLGVFVVIYLRSKFVKNSKPYPPGPLSLPLIGSIYALGNKPHQKLAELKQKYGNIIAIDFGHRRAIILNDFDTIKSALSLRQFQKRASMEASDYFRGDKLPGIVFSSGKTNEEQRGFVMRTLKSLGVGKNMIEGLMLEELERLFENFDKKVEKPILNKELFNATAASALWNIISGESAKKDDEVFAKILHLIRRLGNGFNIFVCFLPSISKLFPNFSGWNDFTKSALEINQLSLKSIREHKKVFQLNDKPRDVIEAYLQKIENTQNIHSTLFQKDGEENMMCVVSDLLTAGTDTIATALDWLLVLLMHNQDKQEKIHAEIDKILGSHKLPSVLDRKLMPYVEAAILEILRFSSLIPLGIPHETSEDAELEGYIIPKGTVVLSNLYESLHDPKRWNDPEAFKPERFLNDDETEILRDVSSNVNLAFGYGKRSCPGEALTKDELFLFTVGLCQRYLFKPDLHFNYSEKIETDLGVSLVPKPHSIVIYKRKC